MITLESSEERSWKRHDGRTVQYRRTGCCRRSQDREFFQYRVPDDIPRIQSGDTVVVKTITPKVEGVLVVAEGAGKGNMASEITQIIQALFGGSPQSQGVGK